jgi:hypothetical protein
MNNLCHHRKSDLTFLLKLHVRERWNLEETRGGVATTQKRVF